MEKFYTLSVEQSATQIQTNIQTGLNAAEVKKRQLQYGPNILKQSKGKNPLILLLSQFSDFLVIILIIASAISFLLGERIDGFMIVTIVILNAIVGFIQEYRVEKAIEHLKKLMTSEVIVLRDGNLTQILSTELVPGDIIHIEEGQKITADIRLIQSINLQTIESSLTGESTPVTKITETLSGNLAVADQKNMLFSGTSISSGKGIGMVIGTGMNTQIGKIAHMVSNQQETQTPMQKKLDNLGGLIGKIVLVVCAMVALEEMLLGEQQLIQAFISAVALAVAAIPEGLPAVVTISLALGTKRLLTQKSLIRNLPAAETLGSTDVICSDKTGTLTEGIMSVRQIFTNDQLYTKFTGLNKLLEYAYLASNARKSGEKIIGDTTEAALIQAGLDNSIDYQQLDNKYTRVQEIPFNSNRKFMTTISQDQSGDFLVTSKGATEVILRICSKIEKNGQIFELTDEERQKILNTNNEMASNALRVLAFAYKTAKNDLGKSAESDLVFLGLQGMMDPPKPGVKQSIEICQNQAGIRVIMITGDHLLTAQAVAKEIGIQGEAITGQELDKLSDEEFAQKVKQISVYARVDPEHKLRIVHALKAQGHLVAMTGDGVNDAPALKAADIGVAMGITGTDVAKDSSDMVLLDDNFKTIVSAVKEGRAIYDNIRKFVNYLLSSNMMEVSIIFIALILGFPIPLLPIHLLWINLVTDGLPAIALGVDPARKDIMSLQPKVFAEEIVTRRFFIKMIIASSILTIAILGIFYFYKDQAIHGQTMVFSAVVLFEMIRLMAIRSEYHLGFFSNKYLTLAIGSSIFLQLILMYTPFSVGGITLQQLFKIQALNLTDWGVLVGAGIVLFIIMKFLTTTFLHPSFNLFQKTSQPPSPQQI